MKKIKTSLFLLLVSINIYPQLKFGESTVRVSDKKTKEILYEYKTTNLNYFYKEYDNKQEISVKETKEKLNKNLDLNKIETEFIKLYLSYNEKIKNPKYPGYFLDTLSLCQLNYMSVNTVFSHEQENKSLKTLTDRVRNFYDIYKPKVSEIATKFNRGDNEYDIANHAFNNFLLSKNHKKIIDDKNLLYFNFKFKYGLNDYIICIGTFSSEKLKLKESIKS